MQHQPDIESTAASSSFATRDLQGGCECNYQLKNDDPRIIIIGAGMAGLSAAYHLNNLPKRFNNICILEAKNRIGGRTCTVPHEKGVLELGAQWIQGQKDNPVWKFAVEHNIVDELNPSVSGEGLGDYLTPDGTLVPPTIVNQVNQVIEDANESCGDYLELLELINTNEAVADLSIPKSVEECFRKAFNQYLDKCDDAPNVRNLKEGLYNWNLTFHCLDNACHSLDQLSALTWGEYINLDGNRWVNLPSGYQQIIDQIVTCLPPKTIVTNKAVTKIEWGRACSNIKTIQTSDYANSKAYNINNNNNNTDKIDRCFQAKLTCSDGSSYFADHVILTTSLGFLKANQDTIFQPLLPLKKRQTILSMGFGTLNKIFLVFETPFWEKDTPGYQLIWPPNSTDHFSLQVPKNDYHWYKDITGFDVLPNHSNILLGWIGKRGAEIMENLSDSVITETCSKLLNQFTGKHIPRITKLIRSSWFNDPYTKGSYSSRTIEMDEQKCHTDDLSSPIFFKDTKYPLLQFAGEATDTKYFSTVHGAFISGIREAGLLIELYQRN